MSDKANPAVPATRARFALDVAKLTSGTILAQAVSIVAAPFIARMFSPAAFGVASLFASLVGILSVVICLRYDRSIIVPAKDEDALNLVAVSLTATGLVSGLSLLLFLPGETWILGRLNAPELVSYVWLIPLNLVLMGILAALYCWNTRKAHFTLVTIAQTLASLCYVGLALAFGYFGWRSGGYLIVATLVGTGLSAVLLSAELVRQWWSELATKITLAGICRAIKEYHRFPKYSTGAALLNSISWELPNFMLAAFFSPAVVGQYAMGNRVVRIPMSLLGINISRVFSQRAAECRHNGTLNVLVASAFQSMITLGMFPFLLLTFVGKDLFRTVFGTAWIEAGVFTEILSVWAFFWFLSGPLASVVDILNEQAFDLKINVVVVVTRALALLAGGFIGDPRVALTIFSITGVGVYAYYCITVLQKAGVSKGESSRILFSHLPIFLPYGFCILAAKLLGLSSLGICILSAIMLIIYYASVVRKNSGVRQILYSILQRTPWRVWRVVT